MKIASLRKKKDFNLLFSKGKRVFKEHLNIVYFFFDDKTDRTIRHCEEQSDVAIYCLKIAYIVSKKISPKAVVRNKIKRRMRAAIRQILREAELDGKVLNKDAWIAILSSKKILDVSFQQIYLEIKQAFDKIQLW